MKIYVCLLSYEVKSYLVAQLVEHWSSKGRGFDFHRGQTVQLARCGTPAQRQHHKQTLKKFQIFYIQKINDN